jgi:hypothetical protein
VVKRVKANRPSKLTNLPILTPEATNAHSADAYGPGRPSPENARRPIEERIAEARELLGEMERLYNRRVAILLALAGLGREEAERRALSEVKASDNYQRWRALG